MSKLFRVVSTVMIAVGLVYLFVYAQSQNMDKLTILEQPSYFVAQNLWLMFVAGIVVVLFSVLGSFFSWFKKMDPEKEALPNAGYASDQDIHTWVSGEADGSTVSGAPIYDKEAEQTEVLDITTEILGEATEVLSDGKNDNGVEDIETVILRQEDEI